MCHVQAWHLVSNQSGRLATITLLGFKADAQPPGFALLSYVYSACHAGWMLAHHATDLPWMLQLLEPVPYPDTYCGKLQPLLAKSHVECTALSAGGACAVPASTTSAKCLSKYVYIYMVTMPSLMCASYRYLPPAMASTLASARIN